MNKRGIAQLTAILAIAAWSVACSEQSSSTPAERAYIEPISGEEHVEVKKENPRAEVFKSGQYEGITTPQGLGANITYVSGCETGHDYNDSETSFSCSFSAPAGSNTGLSIHFQGFNTEANYDFAYLYDENDTMVAMYHGKLGDFWSEYIQGNKVTVRFVSDRSIRGWGFKVDKVAFGGIEDDPADENPAVDDPAPPVAEEPPAAEEEPAPAPVASTWQEANVNYQSVHGKTLLRGKTWHEDVIIRQSGADAIKIHFKRMKFDLLCFFKSYCQVKVEVIQLRDNDSHASTLKTYSGKTDFSNRWQQEVANRLPGDNDVAVKIRFSIDTTGFFSLGAFNEYGYSIDRVNVKGAWTADHTPQQFASKFPIILEHGFGGFDSILGIDYFFRVKDYLTRKGFQVFVTEVPPMGALQTRANALAEQVDAILLATGAERVHVIGHSMGGLDARMLVSDNTSCVSSSPNAKDRVCGKGFKNKLATITTVATPHRGTALADIIDGLPLGPIDDILFAFVNIFGSIYNNSGQNDGLTALYNMTSKFTNYFNADHPVPAEFADRFFTYAGQGHNLLPFKSDTDEIDLILSPMHLVLSLHPDAKRRANDGLVDVWSAKWKDEHYRSYNPIHAGEPLIADHLNQIGQLLGITDPKFNHLEFFLHLANQARDNEG